MYALLNRLCRRTSGAQPMPAPLAPAPLPGTVIQVPGDSAATHDAAAEPAPAGVCGWFDSSLDLRHGLAVSEVRDPDWTVLVLWFGPAALRPSARLQ